jgi:predicted SAM-dependent methyltransferase
MKIKSIELEKVIQNIFKKFGLDVKRINDDSVDESIYRGLYSKNSLDKKLFFNVGAGKFNHQFWTNIDYHSDWYKDNAKFIDLGLHYDLFSMLPLPIENEIAEVIYSSHTIEHIKDKHAQHFFDESFKALKKGGLIRLTAPDIELQYRAYQNKDFNFFYWKDAYSKKKDFKKINAKIPLNQASISQLFLQRFATSATVFHKDEETKKLTDEEVDSLFKEKPFEEALEYCCNLCSEDNQKKYPGNHTNWWSRKKLIAMLEKSGFQEIVISGYGQSRIPILRNTKYFDSTHPKMSLYIEGVKK